ELVPQGWHRVAEEVTTDPALLKAMTAGFGSSDLESMRRAVASDRERADLIRSRTRGSEGPSLPSQLSVSSVIDYLRCPKLFYWSQVRPLPRRSSPQARLGTEIHRWVELEGRGQASLIEPDETPDLSMDERVGDPGSASALKDAYRASRFGAVTPLYAE